jgi:hypothetical protein
VVIHVTLMQVETPDEMPPGAVPAVLLGGVLLVAAIWTRAFPALDRVESSYPKKA